MLANQNLTLTASGLPDGATGLFFVGTMTLSGAGMIGDGRACVGGPIARIQPPAMAPMGQSATSRTLDFGAAYGSHPSIAVGLTSHFQFWFRDPMGGGAQSNTSGSNSVTWQ